jgi:hypothetical protein
MRFANWQLFVRSKTPAAGRRRLARVATEHGPNRVRYSMERFSARSLLAKLSGANNHLNIRGLVYCLVVDLMLLRQKTRACRTCG